MEVIHLEIDLGAERFPDERREITLSTKYGPQKTNAAIYGPFALHLRMRNPECGCEVCQGEIAAVTLTHIKTGWALCSGATLDSDQATDPNQTILFMEALIAALESANLDWDFEAIDDMPAKTDKIAPVLIKAFFEATGNGRLFDFGQKD